MFWDFFSHPNLHVFSIIFTHLFYHFLETCWNSFWSPLWDQSGPRGPRWAQKSHQELQRTKNLHFQKPLKTHWFFKGFWLQRLLKKASRGPRWLPKGTQKIQDPKNRNPKLRPKIIKKIGTNFGAHSETQAQPKKNKSGSIFGTPFPRISGIQIMPRQKRNETCEKTSLTEIVLYKRKGGIRTWVARVKERHY